jgi:AcrR family transcriptional regulator
MSAKAPASAGSRSPRFEEKRRAILDAAARLFVQKGVRGATLADVARDVGLITNSVTYYYRRKEDLATACMLATVAALDGLVARAEGAAGDPRERLRAFLELYLDLLARMATGEHPPLVTLHDMRALASPGVEQVFTAYTALFRRLRALLDPADGPALPRAARNARAHLVISVVHGVRGWIDAYEPEDYGRVAARVADLLEAGVGAPGVPWAPARLAALAPPPGDAVSPEAFLRAATRLVNEQGYRGASVERISASLSVTKGSFYHHNDNKDDLVTACFARTFAVIREAQGAAAGAGRTGWDRIAAAAAELVRWQLSEHGPLLRASALSALPEALRAETERTTARLAGRFGAFLVDGMVDGSVRPLDPGIAAHLVNGAINAAAELDRWAPGVGPDEAVEIYVRPMLMGVFPA